MTAHSLRFPVVMTIAVLGLGACGGDLQGAGKVGPSGSPSSGGSWSNGVLFSATATAGAVQCASQAGSGAVLVSGSVNTSDAFDPITVAASLDGATATQVGTIDPGVSTNYSASFNLASGTHTIELCFFQNDPAGGEDSVCASVVTVTVSCATPPPVLSASAMVGAPQCGSQEAKVAVTGSVSTSDAQNPIAISASIDGAAAAQVGTLDPSTSTNYLVPLSLSSGTHTILMCFSQGVPGSGQGSACAPAVTVTVSCPTTPPGTCGSPAVIGDLAKGANFCGDRDDGEFEHDHGHDGEHDHDHDYGHDHDQDHGERDIPIQVTGDFGHSATLVITGPRGYSLTSTLRHDGKSCVYQYNWEPRDDADAGTYTFVVIGTSGEHFSFTAELGCRHHHHEHHDL